jgi:hypothetical protein
MANPLRRPKQLKDKPKATTAPAGHYPDRVNLTNEHNVCYASAVIQVISNVPALQALLSDVSSLPYSDTTGRDDSVKLNDPNQSKRRLFLKRLSNIDILLENAEERLPAERTLRLMVAMRKINNRFRLGDGDDPSAFFSTIVAILNDAGDKSAPSPAHSGKMISPTQTLDNARREWIKAGGHIFSLEKEAASYRAAHLATGHDSPVTRLMTLELAKESVCSSKTCPSPHARSFHFLNILHLEFPVSEEGYRANRSYSMEDLVGAWALKIHHKTCQHDGKKAKETVHKIVGTPEILVLQLDRYTHSSEHFANNPLTINETLDLRENCERRLPTEELYRERAKPLPTKYKLRAVIRQRGGHFYTYALTPDMKGVLHWARFDDCREEVLWESPVSSIPQNAGQKDDFMFFYERVVDPKPVESIAADKKFLGKSVGGKEAGAGEPVAILSGRKSASDGQKVGKQNHGLVDEDKKEKKTNEPVAGKTSKFSSLEMRNVNNNNFFEKQKKATDFMEAADLKKAAELKRVAELEKAAELKKVADLKKKEKEKEKEKKTHLSGDTFSTIRANHAALSENFSEWTHRFPQLQARVWGLENWLDRHHVSMRWRPPRVVSVVRTPSVWSPGPPNCEPVASKIPVPMTDYAALSKPVSRWTRKFPQLQARVAGLEAWLERHHVSMRSQDPRVVWVV